jgi:acyl carrier protein
MEKKIKQIMSQVFNIDAQEITEDSTQDTIGNWDSLRHMSLVMALEDEFGLELDENQIIEMMSFKLIINVLNDCIFE